MQILRDEFWSVSMVHFVWSKQIKVCYFLIKIIIIIIIIITSKSEFW